MRSIYCLDSSALFDAWNEIYRPSSFPSFWQNLDDAIKIGQIISPEEVRATEIKWPEQLVTWAKNHDDLFTELSEDDQAHLHEVLSFLTTDLQSKGLKLLPKDLKADPMVVALAKARGATVITHESSPGISGRPKIPDLCRNFRIIAIRMPDLIQELNWSF